MKKSVLRTVCLCAVMLALGTALSQIRLVQMPFGGTVTLLSMLPVCFISLYHGVKTGLKTAFAYALIQLLLDLPAAMSYGMTPVMWFGSVIFDYLAAFTVLGLAGLFRQKGVSGAALGIGLACFLRFVSHVFSGVVFFGNLMPEGFPNPLIYSVLYNGAFMLPELIATVIGGTAVYGATRKMKMKDDR